ncbi:MAG: type II toxin-antitoxin system PemK/MazF family toxin [Caulobacteraceae bacterium]
MKRGEIWWVNLDPTLGSEIKKRRPCVIVSNDASNRAQSRVQVVPMTSAQPARVYPWEARVILNGRNSKALADQIRTVAKLRLVSLAGVANQTEMAALEDALRYQLAL